MREWGTSTERRLDPQLEGGSPDGGFRKCVQERRRAQEWQIGSARWSTERCVVPNRDRPGRFARLRLGIRVVSTPRAPGVAPRPGADGR